jgi:hypothetical protein
MRLNPINDITRMSKPVNGIPNPFENGNDNPLPMT